MLNAGSGVIHVSEPLAWCCSFERSERPIYYFLHVGLKRTQWGAHGTAMRLSLETFIAFEVKPELK